MEFSQCKNFPFLQSKCSKLSNIPAAKLRSLHPFFLPVPAGSKWKMKPESTQYQCQNGTAVTHDEVHTADCLQIRSEERATEKGTQETRPAEPNRQPLTSKPGEPRDLLQCGPGGPESPAAPENLPQEEQGGKATRTAKSSSPKTRGGGANTPSPPAARTEKKQRSGSRTFCLNQEAAEKSAAAASNHHAEQIIK